MKTSIVLCTYNGENYLQEQLNSFLLQSRLPDELIVCDDASNDSTISILNDFAKITPFNTKIFKNKISIGVRKNFEKGIQLSTGDLIFFSDQDDVWSPLKVEQFLNVFNNKPSAAACFCDAELVDENMVSMEESVWERSRFGEKFQKMVKNGSSYKVTVIFQNIPWRGHSVAFRSEYLNYLIPFPKFGHDKWIITFLSFAADITFIEKQLVKYRQHRKMLTGIQQGKMPNKIYKVAFVKRSRPLQNSFRDRANLLEVIRERIFEINGVANLKQKLEFLEQHIAFLLSCAQMPSNRLLRVPVVLNNAAKGNYHKHTRGFIDICKDLIEI